MKLKYFEMKFTYVIINELQVFFYEIHHILCKIANGGYKREGSTVGITTIRF